MLAGPPGVPQGRVVLRAPPEIKPAEGLNNLLMQAIPMLGSVGSMAFVAISNPTPKGMIGAGMFLLASIGFVIASGVRQRQQHAAEVVAARREYLAYLAEVRGTIRDAALAQREAAEWNFPTPQSLALLAEERSRVWERRPGGEHFLQVRMGSTPQKLCLTLEAAETAPLAQLDPIAEAEVYIAYGRARATAADGRWSPAAAVRPPAGRSRPR